MEEGFKKKSLRRLQIIKGQLQGLERMIGAEKYCIDIITQSSAIRRALAGVEDLILENHLATHALEQMKSGRGKKAASEILKVYKLKRI